MCQLDASPLPCLDQEVVETPVGLDVGACRCALMAPRHSAAGPVRAAVVLARIDVWCVVCGCQAF